MGKRETWLLENSTLRFTKQILYLATYEKKSFTWALPALYYKKNICEYYLTN